MKQNNSPIVIFLLGVILNIIVSYIYPTIDYSKFQVILECISSGLIVSGIILIFKAYFIQKFDNK